MTPETREVFGISPSLPPSHRHYIFLTVAAEVVDGRLVLLRNAKHEFPTEGNVYVDEPYWVPEGVGAIWRVQRTRTAAEGERQAEYSAVGRAQILPLEIVAIAQRSDAPDGVREQLLEGQDLGYIPASSLLVRLGDGAVIGPIRCEPLESANAFGYRCRSDAFNEPLGFWSDAASLGPLSVVDPERTAREFTGYLSLPKPQSYFDCAPLDYAVRTMLKTVRDHESLRPEINKRHLDALARELAAFSPSAKLERRARRVIAALEDHQLSRVSIDLLRERLASDPAVQQELKALREQTRQDAKAELAQEQKGIVASVKELSSRKSRLSHDLEGLTKQIRDAEAKVVATVDRVAERLRSRIAEVANDPAALLAEVALIRPFLVNTKSSSEPARESAQGAEGNLHRLASASAAVAIESQAMLLSTVEQNLIAVGLVSGSAKRLGREVLASAKAGQAVIFSGSLANELARAVALAIAGEASCEYRVPVGLFDDSEVTDALHRVVAVSQTSAGVAALVLEGMNRSAVEAYGEEIRAYVTEQQLSVSAPRSGVLLIGTLCRGPSALQVAPTLCELGPIIDTDCLTLSTKPVPTAIVGRVTLSSWSDWKKPTVPGDPSLEVESLQRAMQGEESILWRRVVRNACAQLQSTDVAGGSSLVPSISFGWLVPRAHACGVVPGQFLRMLREQALSGENPDPRLKRLLERLYPQPESRRES